VIAIRHKDHPGTRERKDGSRRVNGIRVASAEIAKVSSHSHFMRRCGKLAQYTVSDKEFRRTSMVHPIRRRGVAPSLKKLSISKNRIEGQYGANRHPTKSRDGKILCSLAIPLNPHSHRRRTLWSERLPAPGLSCPGKFLEGRARVTLLLMEPGRAAIAMRAAAQSAQIDINRISNPKD